MSIGRLAQAREESNDQPYSEDVRFWLGRDKTTPASITDAHGWMKRVSVSQSAPVALTTGNGMIVVAGGTVQVRVPTAVMTTLAPDDYQVEILATDATGGVRQVRWTVALEAGLGG